MIIRSALMALALALAAPAAAQLARQEASMAASIAAAAPQDIALLERLVNQNSGTLNPEGVARVAQMVAAELKDLGFETRLIAMDGLARGPHLFATHRGKPGTKRLLLIAHLDTVFEPDSPFQSFVRNGDTGIGPGVTDNKGGIVVILSALRAMQQAGTLADANIEVALTGDEEDAGSPRQTARADLVAAGQRADVLLDFEGLVRQDGRDMGSIARRSSNTWELVTTGIGGHSSTIFSQGRGHGAGFELARIVAAFHDQLPEPNLTFNVGLMASGVGVDLADENTRGVITGKTNIIAEKGFANGDFRTLSPEQTARVRARMEAIVAAHLPGTTAEIRFADPYPPMAPTPGNRALLAKLNAVNRDLGLAEMPELDPLARGAGDIGFVAHLADGLAGMGPSGSNLHAEGETVDLPSIAKQASRAAILMTRLAREPVPAGR